MYDLVTLKGVVVPSGFVDNTLDEADAFVYLSSLGLHEDALSALTLKSVVVPPDRVVLYTPRGSSTITIPPGKKVPVYMGDGEDEWPAFEEYVNDRSPGKNDRGVWEIKGVNEEGAPEALQNGATPFDSDDLAEAYSGAFQQAIIKAGEAGSMIGSLRLLGQALEFASEYQRISGNTELAEAMMTNAKYRLAAAKSDIVIEKLVAARTSSGFKTDKVKGIYSYLHQAYGQRIAEATKLVEDANLDTGWSFGFEKIKIPGYTRSNIYQEEETSATNNVAVLKRGRPGEGLDDLIAVLALSNEHFTPEKLREALSKEHVTLTSLGVDDTPLRTDKFKQNLARVEKELEKLSEPKRANASAILKFGVLAIGTSRPAARVAVRFLDIPGELAAARSLDKLERTYYNEENSTEQERIDFRNTLSFGTLKEGSLGVLVEHSRGIDAVTTNITEPLRRSARLLTERSLDIGHEHLLDEDLEKRVRDTLGVAEIDTKALDRALMVTNMDDYGTAALGKHIAGLMGLTPKNNEGFGKICKELSDRVKARTNFFHLSMSSRLAMSYITNPAYVSRLAKLAVTIFGGSGSYRFDEYSQSLIGTGQRNNGGVLPLAVASYLGNAIRLESDGTMSPISKDAKELFMGEKFRDKKVSRLDFINAVIDKRGEMGAASTLKNKMEEAKGKGTPLDVRFTASEITDERYSTTVGRGVDSLISGSSSLVPYMDNFMTATTREDALLAVDELRSAVLANMEPTLERCDPASRDAITHFVNDVLVRKLWENIKSKTGTDGNVVFGGSHGTYFESVQLIGALTTLLPSTGKITGVSFTEQTAATKSLGNLYKKDPAKAFNEQTKITWKDSNGNSHYLVPSYSNTGAADAIHITRPARGNKASMMVLEFKMSRHGNQKAHIGQTSYLENTLRGASEVIGFRTLTLRGIKNISTHLNSSRLIPAVQETIASGKEAPTQKKTETTDIRTFGSHIRTTRMGEVLPGGEFDRASEEKKLPPILAVLWERTNKK